MSGEGDREYPDVQRICDADRRARKWETRFIASVTYIDVAAVLADLDPPPSPAEPTGVRP